MFIIFGCVFEMPLITIILSKMGIINPQILKQVRGVAIVVIFFIAAVVTRRTSCPSAWWLSHGAAVFRQHLPERHLL